jgi:hypothetical protein
VDSAERSLAHPVDGRGGVAGGELAARERVEFADGELADLAVAELGDEVVLDDDPVVRQRGSGERPAAWLAFRRSYGEPPAQVVGYPFVGDGVRELAMLELLGGDPGLGLGTAVEGPAASDASPARVGAETDLREQPTVADADAPAAASCPDTSRSHRGSPPNRTVQR